MRRILHILPLLLAASAFAEPLRQTPCYVNSRALTLSFQTANAAGIDQVHLWVSTDDGQTWEPASSVLTAPGAVRFDAPNDGKYCFYMVLENAGGRSADPPTPPTGPHLTAVVDTAPPTMQIHQAAEFTAADGSQDLRLNVSLIEDNLGQAGIRLFYRATAEAGWQDGGSVPFAAGIINWSPPADIGPAIDIRLVATDQAGNRACDDISNVSISAPPADAPTSAPGAETTGPAPQDGLTIPAVAPVTVAPVAPVALTERPPPAPAQPCSRPADERSGRLRELAARYRAQGYLSLAGARLRDALELSPDDPDVLVDLGSILFRADRYDEADRLFQDALEAAPEHLGAIEGLALVAATQNRYPQARSHLQHLLQLSPQSARHWLHLGDIEHKLGNTAEAHAAWQKALKLEPADETIRENVHKRREAFGRERTDAQ